MAGVATASIVGGATLGICGAVCWGSRRASRLLQRLSAKRSQRYVAGANYAHISPNNLSDLVEVRRFRQAHALHDPSFMLMSRVRCEFAALTEGREGAATPSNLFYQHGVIWLAKGLLFSFAFALTSVLHVARSCVPQC